MKELLGKIDNDEDWYPGKQYGEQRGRKLMDQAWPDLDFATQAVVVVVGETPAEFARRLRVLVEDINARHSVEGLCRELPQRVLALHAAQGGRLDK